MPTFGARLSKAMKARGFTAPDLARLCGVHRLTIGKWLRMRQADLKARHAVCIADAMGIDARTLITGENSR